VLFRSQARLRAGHFRVARLDAAAYAAEEVELPERIEARLVETPRQRRAGRTVDRRESLPGVAAGGGDRGREIELGFATNRPRLDESSQGDAQVVVRVQRLIDQVVQGVIAELRPELRLGVRGGEGAVPGACE